MRLLVKRGHAHLPPPRSPTLSCHCPICRHTDDARRVGGGGDKRSAPAGNHSPAAPTTPDPSRWSRSPLPLAAGLSTYLHRPREGRDDSAQSPDLTARRRTPRARRGAGVVAAGHLARLCARVGRLCGRLGGSQRTALVAGDPNRGGLTRRKALLAGRSLSAPGRLVPQRPPTTPPAQVELPSQT